MLGPKQPIIIMKSFNNDNKEPTSKAFRNADFVWIFVYFKIRVFAITFTICSQSLPGRVAIMSSVSSDVFTGKYF